MDYRQTMHWLKPNVSLASRLAFNFAGQTVDFLRHRDDYQMVNVALSMLITSRVRSKIVSNN